MVTIFETIDDFFVGGAMCRILMTNGHSLDAWMLVPGILTWCGMGPQFLTTAIPICYQVASGGVYWNMTLTGVAVPPRLYTT